MRECRVEVNGRQEESATMALEVEEEDLDIQF
jgi:hypothetical protein